MHFEITKNRISSLEAESRNIYFAHCFFFLSVSLQSNNSFWRKWWGRWKIQCLFLLQRRSGSPDVTPVSYSVVPILSWARKGSSGLDVSEVPLSTAATHQGYFKLWTQFIKLHFWKMVQYESYLLHISLAAGSCYWLQVIYYFWRLLWESPFWVCISHLMSAFAISCLFSEVKVALRTA